MEGNALDLLEPATAVLEREPVQVDLPGTVDWFSPEKGYGFITPDDGDEPVFVHHSAIAMDGFRSLLDGQRVRFATADDGRGPIATAVRLV